MPNVLLEAKIGFSICFAITVPATFYAFKVLRQSESFGYKPWKLVVLIMLAIGNLGILIQLHEIFTSNYAAIAIFGSLGTFLPITFTVAAFEHLLSGIITMKISKQEDLDKLDLYQRWVRVVQIAVGSL